MARPAACASGQHRTRRKPSLKLTTPRYQRRSSAGFSYRTRYRFPSGSSHGRTARRGTIEIAELNYDVMPWSAISGDWFEPIAAFHPGISGGVRTSALPRLPLHLSDTEIDEAELGAQLALRQREPIPASVSKLFATLAHSWCVGSSQPSSVSMRSRRI